jgi:hypothetical protein
VARRSSIKVRSSLIARAIILALIAGTLGVAAQSARSAPQAKLYIDAGGTGGTDADGNKWAADSGYTGGTASTSKAPVTGTKYQSVFRSQRGGMSAYHITVANGTYWVKLLESEHYYGAAGKRVFDVTSEGKLVENNVDVFKQAGGLNKALYVVFKTTVSDGQLSLGFTPSVGNAVVDGIVVEPTTSSSPPPPSGSSILWGMDDSGTYDSNEKSLGRSFALAREYRRLDESFVSPRMQSLVNSGHSLIVSVRSSVKSGVLPYSSITAGKYDSAFLKGFAALNALKVRPYFIFQHEADSTDAKRSCTSSSDSVCGPQFVAAWKHVYNLAKSHGYTRPIFAWTITSYGFNPQTKVRNNYYWPGPTYTDWIGVDAYNGGCNQSWYGTFSQMLNYSEQWIKQHAPAKSVILPEYGATEGSTSTAKANFFKDIPSALTQADYKNIKAVSYWNEAPGTKCNFKINSSMNSYNAYKSVGLNPSMQGKAGS